MQPSGGSTAVGAKVRVASPGAAWAGVATETLDTASATTATTPPRRLRIFMRWFSLLGAWTDRACWDVSPYVTARTPPWCAEAVADRRCVPASYPARRDAILRRAGGCSPCAESQPAPAAYASTSCASAASR